MTEIQCAYNCGNLTVEGSAYCEDCRYGKDLCDYCGRPEIEHQGKPIKDTPTDHPFTFPEGGAGDIIEEEELEKDKWFLKTGESGGWYNGN